MQLHDAPSNADWLRLTAAGGTAIEQSGDRWLVYSSTAGEAAPAGLNEFAAGLSQEPGVATVVVCGITGVPLLSALSSIGLDRSTYHEVRLIVSPEPLPASEVVQLARSVGLPVVVHTGKLLRIPGGTLFPVAPDGRGTWLRQGPDAEVAHLQGPWAQEMPWRGQLLPSLQELQGKPQPESALGVEAVPVPAGLALLPVAGSPLDPNDLLFCIPADDQFPLLVIDQLRDGRIAPRMIADLVRRLPEALQSTIRLAWRGGPTETDWGQSVADELSAAVTTLTGIPLMIGEQVRNTVLLPINGSQRTHGCSRSAWWPIATSIRYQPVAANQHPQPMLESWQKAGDLPEGNAGVFDLGSDWVVEVVASGLWIRRRGTPDEPQIRQLPFDAATRPVIHVGHPLEALTDEVGPHIELLRAWIAASSGVPADVRLLGTATMAGVSFAAAPLGVDALKVKHLPTTEPAAVEPEKATSPDPDGAQQHRAAEGDLQAGSPLPITPSKALPLDSEPAPTVLEASETVLRSGTATIQQASPRSATRIALPPSTHSADLYSTPEQRAAFKSQAGSWYSTHLSMVRALLAKIPSLRSADPDAAQTDLLAARAYLSANTSPIDRYRTNEALRGPGDPAALVHLACIVSGIRRLPLYQGVVFVGCDLTDAEVAAYQPGTRLSEEAFVEGTASPAADGSNAEFAIWSSAGRRVTALSEASDVDQAVFLPGTDFVVLGTDTSQNCTRILLRDDQGRGASGLNQHTAAAMDSVRDTIAGERLKGEVASRPQAVASEPASPRSRLFRFPIGLIREDGHDD